MPTLAHFRGMGRVTATRYPDLHVWRQGTGLWRILSTDSGGDVDVTGPPYATKAEAFADLDATHRRWSGEPLTVPMVPAADAERRVNDIVESYAAARDAGASHEQAMAGLPHQPERQRRSVEGVTEWARSTPGEGRPDCICCDGPHVYMRRLALPEDTPEASIHGEAPNIEMWLWHAYSRMPEGARVRVTVEVVG